MTIPLSGRDASSLDQSNPEQYTKGSILRDYRKNEGDAPKAGAEGRMDKHGVSGNSRSRVVVRRQAAWVLAILSSSCLFAGPAAAADPVFPPVIEANNPLPPGSPIRGKVAQYCKERGMKPAEVTGTCSVSYGTVTLELDTSGFDAPIPEPSEERGKEFECRAICKVKGIEPKKDPIFRDPIVVPSPHVPHPETCSDLGKLHSTDALELCKKNIKDALGATTFSDSLGKVKDPHVCRKLVKEKGAEACAAKAKDATASCNVTFSAPVCLPVNPPPNG